MFWITGINNDFGRNGKTATGYLMIRIHLHLRPSIRSQRRIGRVLLKIEQLYYIKKMYVHSKKPPKNEGDSTLLTSSPADCAVFLPKMIIIDYKENQYSYVPDP
jgi:hypothetical protein